MVAKVVSSAGSSPSRILSPTSDNIGMAALRITEGGIVAYPTETVFGLAANPFDEAALDRLFALKDRPPDKPVLLLIHHLSELDLLTTSVPPLALGLMARFWPGPLTLLLPARTDLPRYITSGSETVAIRQSSNRTALALCRAAGIPITSTSANRSGEPPAQTAQQAADLLSNPEDLVLDGSGAPNALASTIVDATGQNPIVVREGTISAAEIRN